MLYANSTASLYSGAIFLTKPLPLKRSNARLDELIRKKAQRVRAMHKKDFKEEEKGIRQQSVQLMRQKRGTGVNTSTEI